MGQKFTNLLCRLSTGFFFFTFLTSALSICLNGIFLVFDIKCTNRYNCMKTTWKKKSQIWPTTIIIIVVKSLYSWKRIYMVRIILCYTTRSFRSVRKFYHQIKISFYMKTNTYQERFERFPLKLFSVKSKTKANNKDISIKNGEKKTTYLLWCKRLQLAAQRPQKADSLNDHSNSLNRMSCHQSTIIFSPRFIRYSVLWLHNIAIIAHR